MSLFSSHSAPRGVLTVRLIEGRNLHKEDTFGHNDSFIELWLDKDYKQKSDVVKNSENPVWNQEFTFNIDEGSSKHKLYFKVLDKDIADSDKIGEADLDFTKVLKGQPVDTWVKLPALLGLSSHGEIHFDLSFAPQ
jgi:Ca2+-dependent lipid-binding protein